MGIACSARSDEILTLQMQIYINQYQIDQIQERIIENAIDNFEDQIPTYKDELISKFSLRTLTRIFAKYYKSLKKEHFHKWSIKGRSLFTKSKSIPKLNIPIVFPSPNKKELLKNTIESILYSRFKDKTWNIKNSKILNLVHKHMQNKIPCRNLENSLQNIKNRLSLYLTKDDHYETFLCRIVGLTKEKPMPPKLGEFFLPLIFLLKIISKDQMVLLTDIFKILYLVFENDASLRKAIFRLLKPASLSTEEYLAFKIQYMADKLGLVPFRLFERLCVNQSGELTESQLIKGLRQTLDVSVPISDHHVFKKVFSFQNETLNEYTFVSSLEKYRDYFRYQINATEFFKVLEETYDLMIMKDSVHLQSLFSSFSSIKDLESFQNLIKKIDPQVSSVIVEKLYKEIGRVSKESFIDLVFKYNIGNFGLRSFDSQKIIQKFRDFDVRSQRNQA